MKRIFLVTFLVFNLLFASISFAALTETEPNDSIATADSIVVNTWMSGKIDTSSDVDYYKVRATGSELSFSVQNTVAFSTYGLAIYDENGNFLGKSEKNTMRQQVDIDTYRYQYYYAKVYPLDYKAIGNSYSVSVVNY
ncbi:hypothetical protein [Wukongibacter sp. M2B1]|uniref:hypothetical protein n=1 Tax=Wukongibacter sp. M2B1 TaxID=3088895 RepID=UPI003D7A77B4